MGESHLPPTGLSLISVVAVLSLLTCGKRTSGASKKTGFMMSVSHHPISRSSRSAWSRLGDKELLAQCEVDTYRASGPGGQKRNKTSSAVRLRHLPSGLIVIAEESRSQHENKAKALKRLRRALFLHLREELPLKTRNADAIATLPDYATGRGANDRLHLAPKDPRFWPVVGVALDVLTTCEGRVADSAVLLGISTGNFVDFLQTDPQVWQEANRIRIHFGQKPLR